MSKFDFTQLYNAEQDIKKGFRKLTVSEERLQHDLKKKHNLLLIKILAHKKIADGNEDSEAQKKGLKEKDEGKAASKVIIEDLRRMLPKEEKNEIIEEEKSMTKKLKSSEILGKKGRGDSPGKEKNLYLLQMIDLFFTPKINLTRHLKDFIRLQRRPEFLHNCALKLIKIHNLNERLVNKLKDLLTKINIQMFKEFRDKKMTFEQLQHKVNMRNLYNRKTSIDQITSFVKENMNFNESETQPDAELQATALIFNKKVSELTVDEILQPRKEWQVNPHCLRSLYGISPDKNKKGYVKERETQALSISAEVEQDESAFNNQSLSLIQVENDKSRVTFQRAESPFNKFSSFEESPPKKGEKNLEQKADGKESVIDEVKAKMVQLNNLQAEQNYAEALDFYEIYDSDLKDESKLSLNSKYLYPYIVDEKKLPVKCRKHPLLFLKRVESETHEKVILSEDQIQALRRHGIYFKKEIESFHLQKEKKETKELVEKRKHAQRIAAHKRAKSSIMTQELLAGAREKQQEKIDNIANTKNRKMYKRSQSAEQQLHKSKWYELKEINKILNQNQNQLRPINPIPVVSTSAANSINLASYNKFLSSPNLQSQPQYYPPSTTADSTLKNTNILQFSTQPTSFTNTATHAQYDQPITEFPSYSQNTNNPAQNVTGKERKKSKVPSGNEEARIFYSSLVGQPAKHGRSLSQCQGINLSNNKLPNSKVLEDKDLAKQMKSNFKLAASAGKLKHSVQLSTTPKTQKHFLHKKKQQRQKGSTTKTRGKTNTHGFSTEGIETDSPAGERDYAHCSPFKSMILPTTQAAGGGYRLPGTLSESKSTENYMAFLKYTQNKTIDYKTRAILQRLQNQTHSNTPISNHHHRKAHSVQFLKAASNIHVNNNNINSTSGSNANPQNTQPLFSKERHHRHQSQSYQKKDNSKDRDRDRERDRERERESGTKTHYNYLIDCPIQISSITAANSGINLLQPSKNLRVRGDNAGKHGGTLNSASNTGFSNVIPPQSAASMGSAGSGASVNRDFNVVAKRYYGPSEGSSNDKRHNKIVTINLSENGVKQNNYSQGDVYRSPINVLNRERKLMEGDKLNGKSSGDFQVKQIQHPDEPMKRELIIK